MENFKSRPSLTIIMPAYNEVGAIRAAYESAVRAVQQADINDYEIIIETNTAPDGTHDGTPDVAEQISKEDSQVKHIHHNSYAGLGFKYRDAVNRATKDYVTWVPGDNDTIESSFVNILKHIGQAPMIIVYTLNPKARPFYIRTVSKGFVMFCNILFGLNVKYYNGINIFPRELLQKVPMSADNPAFMSEILIYLLKSGVKYIEVPQEIKYTPYPGKTFRLKSVQEVLCTLASLFYKIHFKKIRIDKKEAGVL